MSEKMIACNLDYEEISKLADKVEKGSLSKIKIKNGDCEILIEKESKIVSPPVPAPVPPTVIQAAVQTPVQNVSDTAAETKSDEENGNIESRARG